MDDLDRLYFELVEILRRERPSTLTEPLTVSDVHDQLIPYRRVRDPVGFRSNDDYETALSRLLSGERGYVLSETGEMQEELRAGLEETLPDIRRFRAFPDARVRLNPDEIPPPGHIRYAPPELQQQTAAAEDVAQEAAEGARPSPAETGGSAVETAEADVKPPDEAPEAAESGETAAPASEAPDVAPPAGRCMECGVALPVSYAYCPYCGQRQPSGRCRSCGAELEAAWIFCPVCGAAKGEGLADSS